MEELKLMDAEELFLLSGSIFSLFFTSSYIYYFIKVYKESTNFKDIPIITICCCYLNNFTFFIYSKYILHDSMKFFFFLSTFTSFTFIIIFLYYEYYQDRFDTILNGLLLVIGSLSLNPVNCFLIQL